MFSFKMAIPNLTADFFVLGFSFVDFKFLSVIELYYFVKPVAYFSKITALKCASIRYLNLNELLNTRVLDKILRDLSKVVIKYAFRLRDCSENES